MSPSFSKEQNLENIKAGGNDEENERSIDDRYAHKEDTDHAIKLIDDCRY